MKKIFSLFFVLLMLGACGKKWLDSVTLSVSAEGRGRIWWDEANTLSQQF